MGGWWPGKVSVKGLSYRLTFLIVSQKKLFLVVFILNNEEEFTSGHVPFPALYIVLI